MKIYTELQVRSMLNRAKIFDGEVKSNFVFILSEQDILASETPIELPTWDDVRKAIDLAREQYLVPYTNGDYEFEYSEEEIIEQLKK